MAKDIRQTRREKVVVHLLDNGGEQRMDALHEWSSLKLLAAHQAFSELMEGMVEDGLVRWDGSTFSLHSEGRILAEKVQAAAGKAPVEAPAEAPAAPAPAAPAPAAPAPAAPAPAAPAPAASKPAADDDDDHGHDHGHSHGHDHGHDHGRAAPAGVPGGKPAPGDARYGDGGEVDLPKAKAPRRPPPPPPVAAPPSGLRARVKGAIKKLLGRG